jgi:hypothetical protein
LQGAVVSGLLLQKVEVGKVAGVLWEGGERWKMESGRSGLVGGEKAAHNKQL